VHGCSASIPVSGRELCTWRHSDAQVNRGGVKVLREKSIVPDSLQCGSVYIRLRSVMALNVHQVTVEKRLERAVNAHHSGGRPLRCALVLRLLGSDDVVMGCSKLDLARQPRGRFSSIIGLLSLVQNTIYFLFVVMKPNKMKEIFLWI
jgi:hypothetical protein